MVDRDKERVALQVLKAERLCRDAADAVLSGDVAWLRKQVGELETAVYQLTEAVSHLHEE
jgi:hypothetical protein